MSTTTTRGADLVGLLALETVAFGAWQGSRFALVLAILIGVAALVMLHLTGRPNWPDVSAELAWALLGMMQLGVGLIVLSAIIERGAENLTELAQSAVLLLAGGLLMLAAAAALAVHMWRGRHGQAHGTNGTDGTDGSAGSEAGEGGGR